MNWIQHVEDFTKTVMAFWQMRAGTFVTVTKQDGAGYLSPYKFLVCFLSLAFIIYSANFALTASITGEVGQPVSAMVVRTLVLWIGLTVVGAMWEHAICQGWPVHGRGTFAQILEFRLYMEAAVTMPLMVVDLFAGPPLTHMLREEPERGGYLLALYVFGGSFVYSVVLEVVKGVPGVAAINDVTALRIWAGLLFWSLVCSVFGVGVALLLVTVLD